MNYRPSQVVLAVAVWLTILFFALFLLNGCVSTRNLPTIVLPADFQDRAVVGWVASPDSQATYRPFPGSQCSQQRITLNSTGVLSTCPASDSSSN